jgi:predicted ester cyclase
MSAGPAVATSPGVAVIERMLTEGFAQGNAAIVDELCSPDLIEHQFGMAGRGAEALEHVKAAIRDVHATMPDAVLTIEDWAEAGDMVWVRAEARGTATGPFFGPPSGRPVRISVVDIARIVDGRIAEHWGVPDRFALLAQTGVLDRLASSVAQTGHAGVATGADGAQRR